MSPTITYLLIIFLGLFGLFIIVELVFSRAAKKFIIQAAILLAMGVKIFSIERNHEIYLRTQKLFDELRLAPNTISCLNTFSLNINTISVSSAEEIMASGALSSSSYTSTKVLLSAFNPE